MTWTLILLIISFALCLAATWDKLCSKDRQKIITALLTLILLAASLSIKGYLDWIEWRKIESMNLFIDQQESVIDEASGGTFLGDYAYLVDDEADQIFRFEQKKGVKKMGLRKILPLKKKKSTSQIGSTTANPENADDLEGIASYSEHLYLITSHSLNKKGEAVYERQLFLKVEGPFDKVAKISAYRDLKSSIKNFLIKRSKNLHGKLTCGTIDMEIEGLAIDDKGCVYIGFRKPQLELNGQEHSIVIQASVNSLLDPNDDSFSDPFDIVLLDFKSSSDPRGIVSMEWDHQTNSILILTNNPKKRDYTDPTTLWKWESENGIFQKPTKIKELLRFPEKVQAKGEALIAPPDSRNLFIFVDSEGRGGQRSFNRKKIGLDK